MNVHYWRTARISYRRIKRGCQSHDMWVKIFLGERHQALRRRSMARCNRCHIVLYANGRRLSAFPMSLSSSSCITYSFRCQQDRTFLHIHWFPFRSAASSAGYTHNRTTSTNYRHIWPSYMACIPSDKVHFLWQHDIFDRGAGGSEYEVEIF